MISGIVDKIKTLFVKRYAKVIAAAIVAAIVPFLYVIGVPEDAIQQFQQAAPVIISCLFVWVFVRGLAWVRGRKEDLPTPEVINLQRRDDD